MERQRRQFLRKWRRQQGQLQQRTRRILGRRRWRRRGLRWRRRHDHPGGHHLCLWHGSLYHRAGY
ncbi:uncharacterized protein Dyak_GE27468, isoform A [Drosophila yakuba]|uniref:Uncharacterized protein, isoform A n=1 Tax=Drosophila yakuba TaxID=7245 RepID=A0A0R1EI76_DROYA|nr:uncharacterized protein Dyak_GE27468, isoform A [Drosophila yakuba]